MSILSKGSKKPVGSISIRKDGKYRKVKDSITGNNWELVKKIAKKTSSNTKKIDSEGLLKKFGYSAPPPKGKERVMLQMKMMASGHKNATIASVVGVKAESVAFNRSKYFNKTDVKKTIPKTDAGKQRVSEYEQIANMSVSLVADKIAEGRYEVLMENTDFHRSAINRIGMQWVEGMVSQKRGEALNFFKAIAAANYVRAITDYQGGDRGAMKAYDRIYSKSTNIKAIGEAGKAAVLSGSISHLEKITEMNFDNFSSTKEWMLARQRMADRGIILSAPKKLGLGNQEEFVNDLLTEYYKSAGSSGIVSAVLKSAKNSSIRKGLDSFIRGQRRASGDGVNAYLPSWDNFNGYFSVSQVLTDGGLMNYIQDDQDPRQLLEQREGNKYRNIHDGINDSGVEERVKKIAQRIKKEKKSSGASTLFEVANFNKDNSKLNDGQKLRDRVKSIARGKKRTR